MSNIEREIPEIKNELKYLSETVESMQKQIKEDREELNKLKAELDYVKIHAVL